MSDREHDNGRAKRQKTNGSDMNPKTNPYLAHMYEEDESQSNGAVNKDNLLAGLTRHQTTAEQAKVAEDRHPSRNAFSEGREHEAFEEAKRAQRGASHPDHQRRCDLYSALQHWA